MQTKDSSLAGDSESVGLKTKKAFQESRTFLKSLNPAYEAKCDSFFIICGKPEFFKGVAQKKTYRTGTIFYKGEENENHLYFEKKRNKTPQAFMEKKQ